MKRSLMCSAHRLAVVGALWTAHGCGPGAVAQKVSRSPTLQDAKLQQGTTDPLCLDGNRPTKPLVVDWTSSDRAQLEAALTRGIVVMKYNGCQLEVVSGCYAKGNYAFSGVTPKRDRTRLSNKGELYATVPTSAAKLEARLARWGELNVEMTIIGRYESTRAGVRTDELEGSCVGATHVARAVVAGAFSFYAGAGADIGAGVTIADKAGVGGRSQSDRETLSEDGSPEHCKPVPPGYIPGTGCNAMIRVEVDPLLGPDGVPLSQGLGLTGEERESTGNPRRVLVAGAVLAGLGVAASGMIVGGAVLANRVEDEFITDPSSRGTADDRGATANGLIIAGAIATPVLLAAGIPMVVVGRRQLREIEVSAAPRLGSVNGASVRVRF